MIGIEVASQDPAVAAWLFEQTMRRAREMGRDHGHAEITVDAFVRLGDVRRSRDAPDSSAAEEIAKALPSNARVVKAFDTRFAGTLVAGRVADQDLDVLIAGDDAEAKNVVAGLVQCGGMRPIDVGPLRRARQLGHLGFLHMAVQENLGSGFGSAVKFLKP